MEGGDPNLITISIVLGVVLSLTVPTQPQTSADDFPMQVGMCIEQNILCAFQSQLGCRKKVARLVSPFDIEVI